MPKDLGKLEDDMGSIQSLRGKRPMATPAAKQRMPIPRRSMPAAGVPNPADAGIFTADKGMPPSPDEGPTLDRGLSGAPVRPRGAMQSQAAGAMRTAMGMKKGGSVKKMSSGGSTGSASKRADGIATKGKTKGRVI